MSEQTMKTSLLICLGLVAAACGGGATHVGVPADQIGLVKAGITEAPDPPLVAENTSSPGERPVTPAAYATAPPVVPHAVVDFIPITAEDNLCLDCHAVTEKVEGEPTPIPQSHYVDLRNQPDVVGQEIAGARYVCTSCHVALTDAPPLVENTFER